MAINCPTTIIVPETFAFVDCGVTLTGSSHTFQITDPDWNAQTLYDVWVGTTAGGKEIYDHEGNNSFNSLSLTINGLPTNGGPLHVTWFRAINGDFSNGGSAQCQFTQANIASTATKNFNFGSTNRSFGAVTDALVGGFVSSPLNFSNGENDLEIIGNGNGGILRHRMAPSNSGSTKSEFGYIMSQNPTEMELIQTMNFQSPFDFGGPTNQTTKLGFGFGSTNYVSGSTVDPSGFSMRMIQRNGNFKGYSYASDRSGLPSYTFGEDLGNGATIPIVPGQNHLVRMVLKLNSGSNANGSILIDVDGQRLHTDTTVRWMTSNHNMKDCRFQEFFGGGDSSWSPDNTQYIRYSNVSYSIIA